MIALLAFLLTASLIAGSAIWLMRREEREQDRKFWRDYANAELWQMRHETSD